MTLVRDSEHLLNTVKAQEKHGVESTLNKQGLWHLLEGISVSRQILSVTTQ